MKKTSNKQEETYAALKEKAGYTNVMQTPRLEKIVVSVGVGSLKDKKKLELIAHRLSIITGQKVAIRVAKKSIASFKSRQGETVGYQVTLRGKRKEGFLSKLLNISLPRTKDFRGIPASIVDDMGNATLGIKENSIFPETADEDLKDVFGMSITVVTTAKNKKEATAYLEHLGFPFRKETTA